MNTEDFLYHHLNNQFNEKLREIMVAEGLEFIELDDNPLLDTDEKWLAAEKENDDISGAWWLKHTVLQMYEKLIAHDD